MDEKRIDELVARWEEGMEQGKDIPAIELCRNDREFIGPVQARILALKKLRWIDRSQPSTNSKEGQETTTGPSVFIPGFIINDRYRLDEIIGEGAFGVVWKGLDLKMQRRLAIKIQKAGVFSLPKQVSESNDEARQMAKLKHHGIVAAYDTIECEGRQIIVSELINGVTLEEHIRSHPPSLGRATEYIGKLARRIDYAHKQGILHRDIKPSNILIDRQNELFVADFGIAASLDPGGQVTDDDRRGTLPYMAPEMLADPPGPIDVRTDIYSIGVVFFELLTGRLPYLASSKQELRDKILTGDYRSPSDVCGVPPRISAICDKCLARNPNDRYQSAKKLDIALHAALPHRKRQNTQRLSFLAVTLVLATTIGFIIAAQSGELSTPVAVFWLVSLYCAFAIGQVVHFEELLPEDIATQRVKRQQSRFKKDMDRYMAHVAIAKSNRIVPPTQLSNVVPIAHRSQTQRPVSPRISTRRPTVTANSGGAGCLIVFLIFMAFLALFGHFGRKTTTDDIPTLDYPPPVPHWRIEGGGL